MSGTDYGIVNSHLGQNGTFSAGDLDSSGAINSDDADIASELSGYALPNAISSIDHLTVFVNSDGAHRLEWHTALRGRSGVRVQRSTNGKAFSTIATITGTGTDSYLDTGATVGVSYWYRVRATYADGDIQSAYTNAEGAPSATPAAPGGLAASEIAKNSAKISWAAVTGASGYEIWGAIASGPSKRIARVGSEVTEYVATGLMASSAYATAIPPTTPTSPRWRQRPSPDRSP